MGLAAVIDQAAYKAAGVSGIAGAAGIGNLAGVGPAPVELPITPYAVVYLDPGTVDQPGMGVIQYTDELEIRVYMPANDVATAYATLVGFPDLFEAAWRTDRDLGGTCADSWYMGHGKVEREDWAGVAYLTIAIRIGVYRFAPVSMSV